MVILFVRSNGHFVHSCKNSFAVVRVDFGNPPDREINEITLL
jgi:hypothetical protein